MDNKFIVSARKYRPQNFNTVVGQSHITTTEKHKILPTILSRCQIFDFKRITNNDTVQHLQEIVDKEEIKAEKAALQVIAQKSEGCMRDSLSILDKIVSS